MFSTVLIANRGEIAVRVMRTLRELGIASVAVYSDADADARHVHEADVAVRLGPASARESYLHIARVLDAARQTGAQAIHPGYGFLSENAAFARACEEAGIVFIGPPSSAIELMGDKISAKQAVGAAGVPVVPGRNEPGMNDADLLEAAAEVGYPVLVKPSAGGGGKGMRLVNDAAELPDALISARREAAASFGDDTLFLERFVLRPRHIEVQVLADAHGVVLHLGERECSLQRRHQKIIEEAPSPLLDEATRHRIGSAACDTARACGYTGAGTVEFIVSADAPDEFFFMEMNTRLQVEHPVTELVTGVDLVAEQLRVAAGQPLSFSQDDVTMTGHAVEARVYAETPTFQDGAPAFLPTGGTALLLREASGTGVRVDSGLREGAGVGSTYDPMLAKVIAYGPDRSTALARLDAALGRTTILGVGTNVSFLRALLGQADVRAARLDTGLVERELEQLVGRDVPQQVPIVFALHALLHAPDDGLWGQLSGWRPGEHAPLRWQTSVGEVALREGQATVDGGEPVTASATLDGDTLLLTIDGRTEKWLCVPDGATLWVGREGAAWAVTELSADRIRTAAVGEAELRSPMPGTVIAVHVSRGAQVAAGTPLLVVEAMKMEHTIRAPHAGTVIELAVRAGQSVAVDAHLATVEADPVEAADA